MKFTTEEIKALVLATMPGPMKDQAEEAFIDWLDAIVENTFKQGTAAASELDQKSLEEAFERGFDEGLEAGYEQGSDY